MPNVKIEQATPVAANSDALYNLPPGTLVVDGKDRVYMVAMKPSARDPQLVRLTDPPGFYEAAVQYPLRRFDGVVTIRN